MSSGRLFEDFVPIDDHWALITTGPRLNKLQFIEKAPYAIDDGRVSVGLENQDVLVTSEDVRLGGLFDGVLVYSDKDGVHGAEVDSPTAHQPFVHEGKAFYTDDCPMVNIYCDGKMFIGHDKWQIGNPCWAKDTMYFEARSNPDPKRPDLWQIWRTSKAGPVFVCMGANPAYYDGLLFWGEWNGQCFDYRCAEADRFDHVPADAHLPRVGFDPHRSFSGPSTPH